MTTNHNNYQTRIWAILCDLSDDLDDIVNAEFEGFDCSPAWKNAFKKAQRRINALNAETIGKDEPNLVDDGYEGIKFQSPDYKAINRNKVRNEFRNRFGIEDV